MAYIEFNVSEIARMFGLNPTALTSQMRVHYPDVLPTREAVRLRMGISDNKQRGARRTSIEEYTSALELYRTSDLSIPQVAEKCGVSKSGFSQFMRFYHHDVIEARSKKRVLAAADDQICRGTLSGNGRLYGPRPETDALYSRAMELYRNTALTLSEIARQTGVPPEGLRAYIDRWHKDEKLLHRGYSPETELVATRRFMKSTAAKYADAIDSLRKNPRHIAQVAAEFGLNAEVFRKYLKIHAPELADAQGMTRLPNGNLVKKDTYLRYKDAIAEYSSSPESLGVIARRRGIVYNSLLGFILRNCPEAKENHDKIANRKESI